MEINVEYKDRYLKYKNKYLQLQKQIQQNGGRMRGGVGPPFYPTLILPEGTFDEAKAQKAFINDNTTGWLGNNNPNVGFLAKPGHWRATRFPPIENSFIACMQAIEPSFPEAALFYGGTFGWELGKNEAHHAIMHYLLTPDLIYQFSSKTKADKDPTPGIKPKDGPDLVAFNEYKTPKQVEYKAIMEAEWDITKVTDDVTTLSTMTGRNDFSESSIAAILAGVDSPFNGWVKGQMFAHLGIINPLPPNKPFTKTDPDLTAAASILAYKTIGNLIGNLEEIISNTEQDRDAVRAIFGSDNTVDKDSAEGKQLNAIVERYTGKNQFGPAVPGDNTMFGIINNNYHRYHYCNIHLGSVAPLGNVYAACFTPKHSNPWATDIFRQVVIYMFCDNPLPTGTIPVGTWGGTSIYPVPNVDLFASDKANTIDDFIRTALAQNAHIIAAQLPGKSSFIHIIGCEKSEFSTVLCSHYHTLFLEEQVSLTNIQAAANSNPAEIMKASNGQIHPNIAAYLKGGTKFMNFKDNVRELGADVVAPVAEGLAPLEPAPATVPATAPASAGGFNPRLINM